MSLEDLSTCIRQHPPTLSYGAAKLKWTIQSWMHEEKDSSKEPKRLKDQTTTYSTKVLKKNGTKNKKREDLKKKTLSRNRSPIVFKSNYDHDSVKRTCRVLISLCAASQSVDKAGHVQWFTRRGLDKYENRARNGKGAHCLCIDARFV